MKKGILVALAILAAGGGGLAVMAARFEEKIRPNTFIGIVPVGDLSRDEAMRRLRLWWETERVSELEVTVEHGRRPAMKATPSKLGITLDDVTSVSSLPLDSFWDASLRTVTSDQPEKRVFDLKFKPSGADTSWVAKYVRESIGEPRPARVRFEKGAVIREPEIAGFTVDTANLASKVVEGLIGDKTVQVPIIEAAKKIPDEQLAAIKEVVAEYSTSFNAGQTNRNANLRLASAKIDGMILMPGDIFSFNGSVGQRTVRDGYREAPVLQSGRHDTGIGGGICQVSGTLYNAVVLSNLKVVERSNHSLPSAYLALGRDCTVSWPNPDFKFQNNTDKPIAISRTYVPGRMTFRILGTKVPGQVVKLVTDGRRSWGNGTRVQHDPSLPFGREVVVERGSSGHAINVYRLVYLNGQLVKREVLNHSNYSGSPRIVAVNKTAKRPVAPPPTNVGGQTPTPPPPGNVEGDPIESTPPPAGG